MSTPEQPSSLMIRIAMPIVVLAVGVVGYFILRELNQQPPRKPPKAFTPVVQTEEVLLHRGGLEIAIDGLVVPYREVALSAQVAGRIKLKTPACRAGHFVHGPVTADGPDAVKGSDISRPGTLLFRIDPRDSQLDVERLADELEQAEASLNELKVDMANTEALAKLADEVVRLQRRELARVENLSRSRVATESQIDEARGKLLSARDKLLQLRNQHALLKTRRPRLLSILDNASTMLRKSQLDLARTEIRSPLDGVVIRDHVEQDAYVQKGTPLVTIEDTSAVEVKCSLRMDELYWLWQQQSSSDPTSNTASQQARQYEIPKTPVTIEYELAGRIYQWQGELSRYDGIGLDETTRTVPCRVIVRNPTAGNPTAGNLMAGKTIWQPSKTAPAAGPPALVRGMYVTAKILASPSTRLLRLSQRAIRPGNQIWVVRSGKLVIQKVYVARVVDKIVLVDAVASNLKAGDRVVVSPLSVAINGMAVAEEQPSK